MLPGPQDLTDVNANSAGGLQCEAGVVIHGAIECEAKGALTMRLNAVACGGPLDQNIFFSVWLVYVSPVALELNIVNVQFVIPAVSLAWLEYWCISIRWFSGHLISMPPVLWSVETSPVTVKIKEHPLSVGFSGAPLGVLHPPGVKATELAGPTSCPVHCEHPITIGSPPTLTVIASPAPTEDATTC